VKCASTHESKQYFYQAHKTAKLKRITLFFMGVYRQERVAVNALQLSPSAVVHAPKMASQVLAQVSLRPYL
jgi:hypothetical protein